MKEGKVIKVQDVAFVTYVGFMLSACCKPKDIHSFQAFLLYLYTAHIEFAPFGSDANRKTRANEIVSLMSDRVPRPSPKSIYRLAEKVSFLVFSCVSLFPHLGCLVRCSVAQAYRFGNDKRRVEAMRCCPGSVQ